MFYAPMYRCITGRHIFCFVDEGTEVVLGRESVLLIRHLSDIVNLVSETLTGEYYVFFLRKDDIDLMTDVRAHDQVEKWGSGPLVDVTIFRNYSIENTLGVGSGNTLRVLGAMEQWRLECKNNAIDFFSQPVLVDDTLVMKENFIVSA